jgi:hypothetical protein
MPFNSLGNVKYAMMRTCTACIVAMISRERRKNMTPESKKPDLVILANFDLNE